MDNNALELDILKRALQAMREDSNEAESQSRMLRFMLNRLRSAVALYIHSADHDLEYLISALENSNESGMDISILKKNKNSFR